MRANTDTAEEGHEDSASSANALLACEDAGAPVGGALAPEQGEGGVRLGVPGGGGRGVGDDGDDHDDVDDLLNDQVRLPATRYKLHIRASRCTTTFYACEHYDLNALRSDVALLLKIPYNRICFIEDGRIVPFGGAIATWAQDEEMVWQVATWPAQWFSG